MNVLFLLFVMESIDVSTQQVFNVSDIPHTPKLPEYPDNLGPSTTWIIDMNYLMPFSVMLMILCVLLLILCYLRHRMRRRRQMQRELRLSHIMHNTDSRHFDGENWVSVFNHQHIFFEEYEFDILMYLQL